MRKNHFISKTDIRFDWYQVIKEVDTLMGIIKSSENHPNLNQLGLSHTEDCPEELQWKQSIGSLSWEEYNPGLKNTEKDFTRINPELAFIAPYTYKICKVMKEKFNIGRIRLMSMEKETCYNVHKDFESRYHLAVVAPRDSFLYYRLNENPTFTDEIMDTAHGVGFWIPNDGYIYKMDASKYHTAVNPSNETRIHLVFNEFYDIY